MKVRTGLLAMVVVLAITGSFTSACVPRLSVYQTWAAQMQTMPLHNATVEDVSMLLGAPPTRCEPVEATIPVIGIVVDPRQEKPIVTSVRRTGPGYIAGIRPGDLIRTVAGQPVATPQQATLAVRDVVQEGQPIEIETSRGIVSVVPKMPKTEQCYWEIGAGEVAKRSSLALVNQSGGSAASGGARYQRFFRASCRIQDGFVAGCQENWQQ
jgi:predicted metalloprotease with PDZ domain